MLHLTDCAEHLLRSIASPFDDDPDVAAGYVAAMDDMLWVVPQGSGVVLYFRFYDAGGTRLPGGTADVYDFHLAPTASPLDVRASSPAPYGPWWTDTARAVATVADQHAASDLGAAYLQPSYGPQIHGLRISSIAAPDGAERLDIHIRIFEPAQKQG